MSEPHIYFRIPFTKYWVGRTVRGRCPICNHECADKLSLFMRVFSGGNGLYSWEEVK